MGWLKLQGNLRRVSQFLISGIWEKKKKAEHKLPVFPTGWNGEDTILKALLWQDRTLDSKLEHKSNFVLNSYGRLTEKVP